MKRWLIILVCATLCLAIEQVADADLVVNGNFQAYMTTWDGNVIAIPSWTGWSQTPAIQGSNYGIAPGSYGSQPAPSNYCAFFAGPGPGSDAIGQMIETVPDTTYTFSFYLAQPQVLNNQYAPGDFEALWNGTSVLSITSTVDFGWTNYTYTVLATGSTSTIEFTGRANTSWDTSRGYFLTDVSVSPAAIPEPASLSLLALCGLALLRKRRAL